jgi:hypothetical protein
MIPNQEDRNEIEYHIQASPNEREILAFAQDRLDEHLPLRAYFFRR